MTMTKGSCVGAVIVAGGVGHRFGELKQFKRLGQHPLYMHSLLRFANCDMINEVVLVLPPNTAQKISNSIGEIENLQKVVEGGQLRQDSVLAGVNGLSNECNIVCVHDAARPFISIELIEKSIIAGKEYVGAVMAIPASDTIKKVKRTDKIIEKTLPRETIWLAQTPQVFQRDTLVKALLFTQANNSRFTDESALLESLGYKLKVVEGSPANIKITTQDDWQLAESMLEKNYV